MWISIMTDRAKAKNLQVNTKINSMVKSAKRSSRNHKSEKLILHEIDNNVRDER